MLEFIVLGQIPGTNIQLSFELLIKLLLLVVAGVLIYVEIFKIRPSNKKVAKTAELELDLAQ